MFLSSAYRFFELKKHDACHHSHPTKLPSWIFQFEESLLLCEWTSLAADCTNLIQEYLPQESLNWIEFYSFNNAEDARLLFSDLFSSWVAQYFPEVGILLNPQVAILITI
jgi:hypothetical protein